MGQTKPDHNSDSATLNGWNASITGYPRCRFGITADFAGMYGAAGDSALYSTVDGSGMVSVLG